MVQWRRFFICICSMRFSRPVDLQRDRINEHCSYHSQTSIWFNTNLFSHTYIFHVCIYIYMYIPEYWLRRYVCIYTSSLNRQILTLQFSGTSSCPALCCLTAWPGAILSMGHLGTRRKGSSGTRASPTSGQMNSAISIQEILPYVWTISATHAVRSAIDTYSKHCFMHGVQNAIHTCMQYIYKECYSSEWCVQLLYITIACTITTDSPISSTVSAPSTAALVFTVSRPFIQTDYVGNTCIITTVCPPHMPCFCKWNLIAWDNCYM